MNNALLYLGGLVALVLAALFAVPTFIDWNGYRGVFEQQATRLLGRDVRVGGTVNLRLLPSPYVQFEKVRISDAEGGSGDSLFRADNFKMWLSVPPLLRGIFEAHEIELRRPVLRLSVDSSGGGNWSTLTFAAGSLPFVPADVALERVSILNGVLSLNNAAGQELARIEGVNGELNSETLEGPFKFRGTMLWEGGEREVRLATARPDPNGAVRFKSTVIVTSSGNSYVVDGRAVDIRSKPVIEGEVTAKLALSALQPEAGAPAAAKTAEKHGGIDVRAKLNGTAQGFKLSDIAVSIDRTGPPQIITGNADMSWAGDKVRLMAGLESKWLDLDIATPNSQALRPLDAARGLFEGLTALLPVEAETDLGLKLEQVNLGGDAISGVRLKIMRAGGPLEVKEFRASIPGGGRLALDGILDVAQSPAQFDGNLALDGQSVLRFLTWALKSAGIAEGRTDSAFGVAGKLQLGGQSVALRNVQGEIGALPVSGGVVLKTAGRPRLDLTLEAAKLDAGQLFPASVGVRALPRLRPAPSKTAAEAVPAAPADAAFDVEQSDLHLVVRAGELLDGDRVLKDVDADILLEGDRLTASRLRFKTGNGLDVDVFGDIDDIGDQPKGALRGTVAAQSSEAVSALFRLLDRAEGANVAEARLAEITPFRLAGTVKLGLRTPGAIDVVADGAVDGGRLVADLRLDGARQRWVEAPVDMTATVEGSRAVRTLAGLTRGTSSHSGEGLVSRGPRKLSVKAAGTPSKGLISVVSLHGEGLNLDYNGRIRLPADGDAGASGTVKVSAADIREALSIIGLPFGGGLATTALDGEAEVAIEAGRFTLRSSELMVGGRAVSGELAVKSDGTKNEIAAKLETASARIPGLLYAILATPPPDAAVDAAAPAPPPAPVPVQGQRRTAAGAPAAAAPLQNAVLEPGLWPEQQFDLSFLDRSQGTIDVRVGALELDKGLTISDATLAIGMDPQRLQVKSLEGKALGGRLTSQLNFERAAAGIGLDVSLKIAVGDGSTASALDLKFDGRALSPAALMTALKGQGDVTLGDVTLTGMGPAPVAATAEAALQGKIASGGEALSSALKAALKQGQVRLGSLKIPAQVVDGTLKLERVTLEQDEGRSSFDTAVDLATMKIDSEWRIEAKIASRAGDPASAKFMLPPVSVVYSGSLRDFAALEPAVETAALERELTVRKMERDVDELERLRRLDQSKAQEETDRRKALEAEQQPPAPAPQDGDGTQLIAPDNSSAAQASNQTPGEAGDGTSADASPVVQESEAKPAVPAVKRLRPAPARRPSPPEWKPFQITPY